MSSSKVVSPIRKIECDVITQKQVINIDDDGRIIKVIFDIEEELKEMISTLENGALYDIWDVADVRESMGGSMGYAFSGESFDCAVAGVKKISEEEAQKVVNEFAEVCNYARNEDVIAELVKSMARKSNGYLIKNRKYDLATLSAATDKSHTYHLRAKVVQNEDEVEIQLGKLFATMGICTGNDVLKPLPERVYDENDNQIINEDNVLVALRNSDIEDIVIQDGITGIGEGVFRECKSLTSITIPDSVTSIGEYAFFNCRSLTSIIIPEGVTSIGEYTFRYCDSLTSITLPDSVTSIGEDAFSNCDSLTSIIIPDSVTSIGEYAFSNCDSLTSIIIPEGVTSIGENTFWSCDSLTSITLPDSVTSIGKYAFSGCKSLTSINIPDSVTSIGEYAFSNCDSLTSIIIPEGVTSIGENTFWSCDNLTSIALPDSVTSIGKEAFLGCKSLTGINIPDSVISIGNSAFAYCEGLTSIVISNNVTSIGNSVFYECNNLINITIPDSVMKIEAKAFSHCKGLRDITIPNSVTSIAKSAFSGCKKLVIKCEKDTEAYKYAREKGLHFTLLSVDAREQETGAHRRYKERIDMKIEYIEFGYYPQIEIVGEGSQSGVCGKAWESEGDYEVDKALYEELKKKSGWDANNDKTVSGKKYHRIKSSDSNYAISDDDERYDWLDDLAYHYFRYDLIKWRVLESNGDEAFLLSEIALDCKSYDESGESVTWETCTLRNWLNSNFLNAAFTKEEQAAIIEKTIKNEDNKEFGTEGGNDTNDKIFLLSESEVYGDDAVKYGFASDCEEEDKARQSKSSTYAKAMGTYLVTDLSYLGNCWWWLRSPGDGSDAAACVSYNGYVYRDGSLVYYYYYAVRPALHLNLKSINQHVPQIKELEEEERHDVENGETLINKDGKLEINLKELAFGTSEGTTVNRDVSNDNGDNFGNETRIGERALGASDIRTSSNRGIIVNADNIEPTLIRIELFIEESDWQTAGMYCESALDVDPTNAKVYIFKLMIEKKVTKREKLGELERPFDDSKNYTYAIRFGGDEVKAELDGYLVSIRDRNNEKAYSNAVALLNSSDTRDIEKAKGELLKLSGYKDAAEKAASCDHLITEIKLSKEYQQAEKLFNENLKDSYTQARSIYEQLGEYKDSREKVLLCSENINSISYDDAVKLLNSSDTRDIENAKEELLKLSGYKDAAEKAASCDSLITEIKLSEEYQQAEKLFNKSSKKSYFEARSIYEKLGEYKDSKEKVLLCSENINSISYDGAVKRIDEGTEESLRSAIKPLTFLMNIKYKDSEELMKQCNEKLEDIRKRQIYDEAKNLYESDNMDSIYSACEMFKSLGDYDDAAFKVANLDKRIKEVEDEVCYSQACKLKQLAGFEIEKLERASEMFSSILEFKDSEQKMAECRAEIEKSKKKEKYSEAEKLFESGSLPNLEKAKAIYTELGEFNISIKRAKQCQEKINESQYRTAGKIAKKGSLNEIYEAKSMYEQLEGYKDSRDKVKECEVAICENIYSVATNKKISMDVSLVKKAREEFMTIPDYGGSKLEILDCDLFVFALESIDLMIETIEEIKTISKESNLEVRKTYYGNCVNKAKERISESETFLARLSEFLVSEYIYCAKENVAKIKYKMRAIIDIFNEFNAYEDRKKKPAKVDKKIKAIETDVKALKDGNILAVKRLNVTYNKAKEQGEKLTLSSIEASKVIYQNSIPFKDSYVKCVEAKKTYEVEKLYRHTLIIAKSKDVGQLTNAVNNFTAIKSYKDCSERLEVCKERLEKRKAGGFLLF